MTAPDADIPTLHIRCGSDIRARLAEAGFMGAFLEVSDPLPQGPVRDTQDYEAIRARFIATAYERDEADALQALLTARAAIEEARAWAGRLVLWFEHDSYDQLTLARLLAALAGHPGLELICIDGHPRFSATRFIGLGQLTSAELRALWPGRTKVTQAQAALGLAVWNALRSDSPETLATIAMHPTPAIPPMQAALRRHLQELPWHGDGLSLTERLALTAIADGAETIGQVFAPLQRQEPLPYLGDLMLLPVLSGLAGAAEPAITIQAAPGWPDRPIALLPAGRALLDSQQNRQAHWQAMQPPERWVGGVRIGPGQPAWRWDEQQGTATLLA